MSAKIAIGETLGTASRLVLDRAGELFRVGLVLIVGFFAIGIFALEYVLPLMRATVPQVGGPAAGSASASAGARSPFWDGSGPAFSVC